MPKNLPQTLIWNQQILFRKFMYYAHLVQSLQFTLFSIKQDMMMSMTGFLDVVLKNVTTENGGLAIRAMNGGEPTASYRWTG